MILMDYLWTKLASQSSSRTISKTVIICVIAGFIRKANNHYYLTKKYRKLINSNELLIVLLNKWINKFNWGYFDGYEENSIGPFAINYTIYLLLNYGNIERESTFYAKKFFKALPMMHSNSEELQYDYRTYTHRAFFGFLRYFGLIEINS